MGTHYTTTPPTTHYTTTPMTTRKTTPMIVTDIWPSTPTTYQSTTQHVFTYPTTHYTTTPTTTHYTTTPTTTHYTTTPPTTHYTTTPTTPCVVGCDGKCKVPGPNRGACCDKPGCDARTVDFDTRALLTNPKAINNLGGYGPDKDANGKLTIDGGTLPREMRFPEAGSFIDKDNLNGE